MPICRCISGTVVVEGTGSPVAHATVRLFVEGRGTQSLAEAETDGVGRFSIDVAAIDVATLLGGVFRLDVLVASQTLRTHGDVRWPADRDAIGLVLCAELPSRCATPADEPEGGIGGFSTASVYGVVRHVDGTPLAGKTVRLFDVGFGEASDTPLAETTTSSSGWFSFSLGGTHDFFVKVYGPSGLVGTSSVVYRYSGGSRRVDIRVCDPAFRGASEFARLTQDIIAAIPVADAGELTTALLTATVREVAWLCGRTGWSLDQVTQRVTAETLAATLSSPSNPVSIEAIYGLLRQGLPANAKAILARPPSEIRAALSRSRHANIIGFGVVIADVVASLVTAVAAALDDGEDDALGKILRTSAVLGQVHGLTDLQVKAFCTQYAQHGHQENFWALVDSDSHFDANASAEARRLIRLGTIGLGHAPCVTAILWQLGTTDASATALWTTSTWNDIAGVNLLAPHPVSPLPDGLDGASDHDKRVALARLLQEHAELAFPQNYLSAQLAGSLGVALGVSAVFIADPSLDLRTMRIDPSHTMFGGDLDLVTATQRAQRLSRIAPSTDAAGAMGRLADMGVNSARTVARMGRTRFLERYGNGDLSLHAEALEIHAKAKSQAGMAAAFFLQAHPALSQHTLPFVPTSGLSAINDSVVPGWSTLFTTPTGTSCEWCQSVHGPSAYLVDLLSWLEDRTKPASSSSSWGNALAALTARRPDLVSIDLTCENAERVLPYIDLTMEVLESVVVGTGPTAHDSESETPEMLAAPQYTEASAYGAGKLGDYTRSFLTPFHQPLAEARAFLAHLDINRTDLMRAFSTGGVPSATDIATEELHLSTAARGAITAGSTSEQDYWEFDIGLEPTVRQFRRAAGITYADILDLLHTRCVNPTTTTAPLEVLMAVGGDPYDVSSYQLFAVTAPPSESDPDGDLAAPTLDQLQACRRVVRLQRATGWSTLDIDKISQALGNGWDDVFITAVGDLHRLSRMTGRPPVEIASWFGVIDTFPDRDTKDHPVLSLYDRTFYSTSLFPKTELEALGGDGKHSFPFVLTSARDALDTSNLSAEVPRPLAAHADKLHAVLGVDETEVRDLITLLRGLGVLDLDGAAAGLTLANLTWLYRFTSLGRALRIKPTEALRISVLAGESPASGEAGLFTSPSRAVAFVERVQKLLRAGWSADELDYIVLHKAVDRVGPTDDYLQGILGRLRDTARTLTSSTAEDAADTLVRQLASELGIERTFVDALNESMWFGGVAGGLILLSAFDVPSAPVVTLSSPGLSVTLLEETDGVAAGSTVLLHPGATVQVQSPIPNIPIDLVTDSTYTVSTTRPIPITVLTGTFTFDAVDHTLTESTTASQTTLPLSVLGVPTGVQSAPAPIALLTRFQDTAFLAGASTDSTNPWADLTRDAYPGEFAILDAVCKAAWLVKKLGADEDEREAWDARVEAGWTLLPTWTLVAADLASCMLGTDEHAPFARLSDTVTLFRQRARLPGSVPTFAEVMTDPSATNIATRTDWDETWLEDLDAASITSATEFERFLDRVDLTRRAGTNPQTVATWANAPSLGTAETDFTSSVSASIVAAARSRYEDANRWASVARPVRDLVRKAQRDALVSYLLVQHNAGLDEAHCLDDADALYQHYLIDVSMNPEMLTSRIVQASCTVQLFIHRTLFGLEVDDTSADLGTWFNDEDRAEWEWMKTYRIWEAARKVFLYPENWIEPELRDDKTPFFKTLERTLAQGDVTDETVEQVTLDYLDQLHNVASMQVLACHVQKESDDDGEVDYLHVFSRTYADPPSYWYRRREDGATWTAWEKIDAGVQGEQLIPVVYNRRLLLFWAEFTQAQSDVEGANPASWWEVRLAMSEYRDGKWSPKRVSSDALSLRGASAEYLNQANSFSYGFLSAIDDDNTLTITCFGCTKKSALDAPNTFSQLGTFTLDACTMEIEVGVVSPRAWPEGRLAISPVSWWGPGFWTYQLDVADDSLTRVDELNVHVGEVDANGDPVGDVTAVAVLGALPDAIVVVPGQWVDFVAQSPFFVNVGERVYFVEPSTGADADLAAAGEDDPPMTGISTFRAGTTASQASVPGFESGDDENVLTEAEATEYLVYLPKEEVSSTDSAIAMLQRSAAALAGEVGAGTLVAGIGSFKFSNFYHPHVCRFIKEVRRDGALRLLNPDPSGTAGDLFRQGLVSEEDFESTYAPTLRVDPDYPVEDIDFELDGAYSQYNWEIFFHLPFYVANRLVDAGRFDDAFDWFHCIFDPRTRTVADTDVDGSQWWKVKPLLASVSAPVTDWAVFTGADGDPAAQAAFEAQVAAWREDPFNPHLLARLRPGTYQRALVMRYIDSLIAWGDALFSKDTIESINEATQLYVFAKNVLGDRPELLTPSERPEPKTYTELSEDLDAFGNALVAVENACFSAQGLGTSDSGMGVTSSLGYTAYFCVPFNRKLLSYWDTISDRLFKIRNGMNIEGVVRSLPLFQPVIDPALLVRAAAAGVDIGSAANGAGVLGNYRFNVMLSRAQALANSVKGLGQALLSALEKRDAEALSLLRQGHEEALLEAVKAERERQVDEARENLNAAKRSRDITKARYDYYDKLIEKKWISEETEAADLTKSAMAIDDSLAGSHLLAAVLSLVPDTAAGVMPFAQYGGSNLGPWMGCVADGLAALSAHRKASASHLTTTAGYKRRASEWKNQRTLAGRELSQIDAQITAAEIRLDIAKKERSNQDLQIRNSAEVRAWMESKFTSHDLYDWMVGQVAALYFQSWQLAYATAKKAEACYQHEMGDATASFVQAVHWDSTRKGLLAGDKLAADLERMDTAYLDNDVREFELTKHVSLLQLDPIALQVLRETGTCYFSIAEAYFDLDCPDHDFRRIQSVALSLSCVTGPFGTVNAELTLHASSITPVNGVLTPDTFAGAPPSIVTSVASNDSGLFQTDLRDPRYLPFERRGAVSTWQIKLKAQDVKQLDWLTIEDVTLHLRYTARPRTVGDRDLNLNSLGLGLVNQEETPLERGLVRVVSLLRDFPDDFAASRSAFETSISVSLTTAMLSGVENLALSGALAIPIGGTGPSSFAGTTLNSTFAEVPFYTWDSVSSLTSSVTLKDSVETSRLPPVLERRASPPEVPAIGDRYLVSGTATGDWALKENHVAQWTGTTWDFTNPTSGAVVHVDGEGVVYISDGTTWTTPPTWSFHSITDLLLVLLYT